MTEPAAVPVPAIPTATTQDIITHKITVARTARYATTGASPANAARLWVVFHGYGMRAADFIAPFADAAPGDTRVIAPEGLSRFYAEMPRPDGGHLTRVGASWLTRDDRDDELRDAIAMLHAVVAREHAGVVAARGVAPQLGVLGFSQGVAMSMRFAADLANNPALGRSARLNTHILWAGGLAHDVTDEVIRAPWHGTTVRVVVGERDQFATDAFRDSMRTRLLAIGATTTAHSFAGGHRLDTPLLGALLGQMLVRSG